MELQNIRRIGVFKMRNIGDVLMITPFLRALKETFPEAQITGIVNAGTEDMLAHNPDVADTLAYPRGGGLRKELRFAAEMRRRKFDMTIGFTDGERTAWYTMICGARYRFGLPRYAWKKLDPRRAIYNFPVYPPGELMHEVEKHFWLATHAGLPLKSTTPGPLHLTVPEELRAWARKEFSPLRPAKVVHIHPVSRWLWKCWRSEAMAEVIDWLQMEQGARVVVTTGPVPRELEAARQIIRLCRTKPLFYEGNLTLGQTAAISAESDGYFGVDTAPMHMAAAVGVPVIALFGPTHARNWGPWSDHKEVLSHPCACNLEHRKACDWSQVRQCMAAITVAEAQAALARMLAQPRPLSPA